MFVARLFTQHRRSHWIPTLLDISFRWRLEDAKLMGDIVYEAEMRRKEVAFRKVSTPNPDHD